MENALYYFTHHSESIIQWLFLAILLISAFVITRAIFARKEAPAAAGVTQALFADGSDVQTFLKKILDQMSKLEGLKLEGMTPAAVGEVDQQVQTLKKDLQAREEELTKLKAGGAGVDLAGRIKELETKLAEYEILEDDIADLSLYKEENVRLRAEIDKLKLVPPPAAAAPPPASTPEPAPAPAPAMGPPIPPPTGEDIVQEFAHAVNQEVTPSEPIEMSAAPSGDPLADFENAVKQTAAPQPAAPMAPPIPPPSANPLASVQAAVPPSSTAAPTESAVAEGDDLFAEFSTPAEDASLDTDKMMAEMADLVSLEPHKGTSGLAEEIDTEKMAAEATRLTKA